MSDDIEVYIKAIDTETSIHEKYGPSPHNGMARAVYIGSRNLTIKGRATPILLDTIVENDNSYSTLTKSITDYPPMFLAGHNIKFDLLHLLQYDPTLIEKLVRLGVTLWDTQLAAYLKSGQTHLFPTLNDVSVNHGLPVKDDTITKMFKDGIGADKIDPETILPYLSQDVSNTLGIALDQLETIEGDDIQFYMSQMDALLAITEMEYNGIRVDLAKLASLGANNLSEQLITQQRITSYILSAVDPTSVSKSAQGAFTNAMNFGSNELISAIIYGGEYKYTVTTPMKDKVGNPVLWKSGKKKGEARVVHDEYVAVFPGMVSADYAVATKKAGVYKVDEQQLQRVRHMISSAAIGKFHTIADRLLAEQFVQDLLNLRQLTKEYGTYIDGLMGQLYPNTFLHGTINQCSTSTGRTSSSNPNLQNLPSGDDSKIKSMFISRWGDDGVIVEADYKQLEVIALAVLSGDRQLIDDILNGRDIHSETGKSVYGHMMSHDERRVVKGVNFAIIYGAGAKGIAASSNISVELATKLVDAFYTRYPEVRAWQLQFATEVKKVVPYLTGKNLPDGKPQHAIRYRMPTGRNLTFTEYEAPKWQKHTGFLQGMNLSPTELKNYPVQSLATGDIVPMMLGAMLKAIINAGLYDNVKMIVTVHDSIVFDVHRAVLPSAIALIRDTLESVPVHLEKLGIKTPLPFKVDISYGPNWKDQTKVSDK